MNRIQKFIFIIIAIVLVFSLMVAAAYSIKLPISATMDFIMIYAADSAWIHGINIYDHASQVILIHKQLGLEPGSLFVPYNVYPPWYVLTTAFLAWFPGEVAAKLWFYINLAIVCGGVWLLTVDWRSLDKVLAQIFALMFLPTLGLIGIGQYTAPVFLGICLLVYAVKKQIVWVAVVGLLLLTFKPHVGILIFLIVASWMVLSQTNYVRRLILPSVIGVLVLISSSFIVDPTWVSDYASTLTLFRHTTSEVHCEICISIPILLVDLITGWSSTSIANVVGVLLLLITWTWFIIKRNEIQPNPWFYFSLAAVFTVLIVPTIRNYDYILLLVPLLYIWQNHGAKLTKIYSWLLLFLAFLSPWVASFVADRLASGLALIFIGFMIILYFFLKTIPDQAIADVPAIQD